MAQIPLNTQFIGLASTVDTTERRSATINAESAAYTMQDIVDTIPSGPAYKVYTALLTQSGGDDEITIDSGLLTIGVTYYIDVISNGDFTNVGAPSNTNGIYFVATGTTPNSWGTEASLIYNTGAPVVTVLENTIGNIYFTFDSDGYYFLNGDNLFISNSWTPTIMILNDTAELMDGQILTINKVNDSQYVFQSYNQSGDSLNGQFYNTPIEIRVYP